MKNSLIAWLLAFICCTLLSCSDAPEPMAKTNTHIDKSGSIAAKDTSMFEPSSQWEKYWYAGKAEIATYFLKQSRYGEIHEGNLTNIFVTEDLSPSLQVKLDDPDGAGSHKIKVLKLNQAVKFVTGIYPYSMMLSCFSPVDVNRFPHAIKITASSQEWCGQSFFQLNNRNNQYTIEQRSYFEKEGDQYLSIAPVLLEDELWNLIRIDPSRLPQGEQNILPGALYLRLSHQALAPVKAVLKLSNDGPHFMYSISYPSLNRKLAISFAKGFPHQIINWSDSFPGIDGKLLTTTAVLNKTMNTDYWMRHKNADRNLREQLGLPVDTQ